MLDRSPLCTSRASARRHARASQRAGAPALAAALAGLVALTALAFPRPADAVPLRVYYPDIEQGSSTLVVSPTGRALLVDAGSEIRSADDDLVPFLRDLAASGVMSSLEVLVATHYDEDHIGHLEDVLAANLPIPTAIVYDRGEYLQTPSSFAYSDYVFAASAYDRRTITPGTVIDLGGGVTATCVAVNGELPDGSSVDITTADQFENNAAVGLVVRYGSFDLWIGGDLTGNPETGVADVESHAAPFAGDLDVYTVDHHGSRTSSNAAFLATLKPELVINQNGPDNGFGHPNAEVVSRILGTPDSCGATPVFVQQNPGNPTDSRSDDSLAAAIADPDDDGAVLGLPGTLLLVSDGTDYQLSGGNVAPITRSTDCSAAPVADFPPAVLRVTRSPWVPTASQAVTVQAAVRDEGTPSVVARWTLGGVTQSPITLAQLLGTDLYEGTIPAQPDGTRVTYTVEATDTTAQTAAARPWGYFSGTTPIASVRLNDAAGALATTGYAARIEGDLTVEPGVFHPFVSQIFVQDASGSGVQVFDSDLLSLARGDRALFVGLLEQFAGQTELNVSQDFGGYGSAFVAAGSAPAPLPLTVAAAGEAQEGVLVRIDGLSVVSGTIPAPGGGNGFLTVSDDGGAHTLTLKIDEDTDVPGAGTPTQPFDAIGVLTQVDSWPPFDGHYELVPRGRADLLSDEVNLPAVLIHEIHADPHAGQGDANGDGTVSSTQDEFVELANPGWQPVDVSGWTLSDAVGVRHTFAAGTLIPPREAAVVFGGGAPTGAFGNAAANGLVFTASTGTLGLNNTGDTLTLADAAAQTVQVVTYGSEGGHDESLTRSPDLSNAPLVAHTTASASGARYSPGAWASDGGAFTVPPGAVVLSEVIYDPTGADGGLEWVELVNTTSAPIDLAARPLSLGWGGTDYTVGGLTLDSGVLQPCAPWLVGGPTSSSANASPILDLAVELVPGLQNSGTLADGVALFDRPFAYVTATTVPADAVIYGVSNDNCLLDASGTCPAPDVGDAGSGQSLERLDLAGAWTIQTVPTPNASPLTGGGCSPPPPPTCLDAATLTTGDLVLSEVLYDVPGADGGYEWVELFNAAAEPVCLDGLSLGWGGSDYTYGGLDLTGTVAAGAAFVVGGPTSDAGNASPTLDQAADLSPDLQNAGSVADGVALFLVPEAQVDAATVPYDAVVYGTSNSSCLLDPTGACATPATGSAAAGSSLERLTLSGTWQVQSAPTPNATPLP